MEVLMKNTTELEKNMVKLPSLHYYFTVVNY